jgi:hypothetical protein
MVALAVKAIDPHGREPRQLTTEPGTDRQPSLIMIVSAPTGSITGLTMTAKGMGGL